MASVDRDPQGVCEDVCRAVTRESNELGPRCESGLSPQALESLPRGRGGRCRTRGGTSAGRGARGTRTRGGAGRGRGASTRPSAKDDVYIGPVENLPVGAPLERPLHAKRRRVFVEPYRTSSTDSDGASPSCDPLALPLQPAPQELLTDVIVPLSPSPSTSRQPSAAAAIPAASLPALDQTPLTDPPSPAEFLECGESGRNSLGTSVSSRRRLQYPPPQQNLREEETRAGFQNIGSEDDSNDDDDDEDTDLQFSTIIPRAMRIFTDPMEDPQESEELVCHVGPSHIHTAWPPTMPAAPSPPQRMAPSTTPPPTMTTETTSVSYGPTDMFDFEWKQFPNPQTSSSMRRETFSQIDCGATAPFDDPYAAFTAIWDRPIMEYIAEETNKYAQQYASRLLSEGRLFPQSRIRTWKDTNADELYVFFAIILGMGIVVKTRLRDYWSSDENLFVTPGFAASMSFNRFQLLTRCLHFVDNATFDVGVLTPRQAKLFKARPLVDHLNTKFSQLYNLKQNIVIDESLTQWKGWLSIKQYIKNKAASVGIRTYELCESETGYLWRFEVHAGSQLSPAQGTPVSGPIPALVLRLTSGLSNRGHTIWMDNYYNSPALARYLKVLGFDCVGTVRTNRPFVPIELTNLLKSDMAMGDVYGCTSGDVDLLVWRDQNSVALISTYHGLNCSPGNNAVTPTLVQDYNYCMGGVDKKDQMLAMYPVERKRTSVWYKKFFRRLLNVSVLNSYVLYNNNPHTQHMEHHTHRSFREHLIGALQERHGLRRVVPPLMLARVFGTATGQGTKIPPEFWDHVSVGIGVFPGGSSMKRVCVKCRLKKSFRWCLKCKVALCPAPCHIDYHT